jgi:hypothetical protein
MNPRCTLCLGAAPAVVYGAKRCRYSFDVMKAFTILSFKHTFA